MQSLPAIAVFVRDASFEVAAIDIDLHVSEAEFENTEPGIDAFIDWLHAHLGGDELPQWIATVPSGDGGAVSKWICDAIPEIFLQNPQRLREYGTGANVRWDSARALLEYNRSKEW